MNQMEIPTRESTWMLTWWVPILAVIVLSVFRNLPAAAYTVVDVVLGMALVFALWRMWQKSSLTLTETDILVVRGTRIVREIALPEVKRVSVTRGAIGVYLGDGRRMPAVSRGMRFRSRSQRDEILQGLAQWCSRHQISFEQT